MKKSTDYLLEALEKVAGKNDKEKAATMKIAQSTLSQYKTGERTMDDFACIMVAKTLGIDPMRIIAAAQEEREKNEERRGIWRDFRVAREREKGQAFVPELMMMSGLMIMGMMAVTSQFDWPVVLHTLKLCELRKRLQKLAVRTNTMLPCCNTLAMQNA